VIAGFDPESRPAITPTFQEVQAMSRMRTIQAMPTALLWMLFAASSASVPSPTDGSAIRNPVPFHPKFGMSLDSLENEAYRLFGPVPGFSAARMYQTAKGSYSLHIIRNTPGGPLLSVRDLSSSGGEEMLGRIRERVAAVESGEHAPDLPVCPLRDMDGGEFGGFYRIFLVDGSMITGTFSSSRSDTLVVKTAGGLFFPIPDSNIGEVRELPGDFEAGRWKAADPNQSRLFFAPTGRNLKAGSFYFADYYVFFPTLAAGLTGHLSVTGGLSLIPGADRQAFFLAPKLTFEISANTGLAAGCMGLKVPGEKALTLAYAVGTLWDAGGSVTAGAGIPLSRGAGKNMVLVAGGDVQVSGRLKLITENWIITGSDGFGLFSGGVRFFGERMSVDLALITMDELIHGGGFPFFPYVDFAVFFGR
jgi:hypothetical protein